MFLHIHPSHTRTHAPTYIHGDTHICLFNQCSNVTERNEINTIKHSHPIRLPFTNTLLFFFSSAAVYQILSICKQVNKTSPSLPFYLVCINTLSASHRHIILHIKQHIFYNMHTSSFIYRQHK